MTETHSKARSLRHPVVGAFQEFMADRALRLGASLAYYGLVTLIPILILILGLVGLFVGEEAANGELVGSLSDRLGEDVAQVIAEAVVAADITGSYANLTILSTLALLFTASALFVAWKDALEVIWGVGVRPGVKRTLLNKLFGVAALGATAALLVAVFVVETVLAALSGLFADEALIDLAFRIAASIAPIVLGGILLAFSYHYGSDGSASWRSIWKGTLLALVLVAVFLWVYGAYVGAARSSIAGVASSVLVLLVLVYFVAQALLYGAEFIKVLDQT